MTINDKTRSYFNGDIKLITIEQYPFGSNRLQKVALTLDELRELTKEAESKLA